MTEHNLAGCEDPLCQRCEDYPAGYVDEIQDLRTTRPSVAWTLSWRFCAGSNWLTEKCCRLGQMGEQGEETVNSTGLSYLVRCPERGRAIRAETAVLMDADYWQHLAKEYGMNRSIVVRHIRRE